MNLFNQLYLQNCFRISFKLFLQIAFCILKVKEKHWNWICFFFLLQKGSKWHCDKYLNMILTQIVFAFAGWDMRMQFVFLMMQKIIIKLVLSTVNTLIVYLSFISAYNFLMSSCFVMNEWGPYIFFYDFKFLLYSCF